MPQLTLYKCIQVQVLRLVPNLHRFFLNGSLFDWIFFLDFYIIYNIQAADYTFYIRTKNQTGTMFKKTMILLDYCAGLQAHKKKSIFKREGGGSKYRLCILKAFNLYR